MITTNLFVIGNIEQLRT